MAAWSADELEAAFRRYWQTGAVGEDWSGWADLFTEDVEYVEHFLGAMRGRETIRAWIVPLMARYGELYPAYEWHTIDVARGRVVFTMQNRRDHPDGQSAIDFSGISMIDYAGGGLWRRQEDYWAAPAAERCFKLYQDARKAIDPDHDKKRTRKDWGLGPSWCQGPPLGPGSILITS